MKIKLVNSFDSIEDLESRISQWTDEINPKIQSVNVNVCVCHDYFMHSAPPMICNTWNEYIATIVYK